LNVEWTMRHDGDQPMRHETGEGDEMQPETVSGKRSQSRASRRKQLAQAADLRRFHVRLVGILGNQ